MPLDNDIPRSRLTSLIERERRRRLAESDPALCRDILNHAEVREYYDFSKPEDKARYKAEQIKKGAA